MIDVSVLAESASPHGINDDRRYSGMGCFTVCWRSAPRATK